MNPLHHYAHAEVPMQSKKIVGITTQKPKHYGFCSHEHLVENIVQPQRIEYIEFKPGRKVLAYFIRYEVPVGLYSTESILLGYKTKADMEKDWSLVFLPV